MTWALLLGAVVTTYVGWLGWHPNQDYSHGQVGGFALTVVLLLGLAIRAGLRPRTVVQVVFWSLLTLNGWDLFLLAPPGDPNFWPLSAIFFGTPVWVALRITAEWMELRDPRRIEMVVPVEITVEPRPDLDAQVAAWRRYRDRAMPG